MSENTFISIIDKADKGEKPDMNIVFLHLSDLHIRNERDISDLHLRKIVDSIKTYKFAVKNIILVISGDLTFSGEKVQFDNVRKVIGKLIYFFKKEFSECWPHILPVPGNHDVCHSGKFLAVESIKKDGYSTLETSEHSKLDQFYAFAKFNKCFASSQIYCDRQIITIGGFRIQANLVNNAIFSTHDKTAEYKSLLYIPSEEIDVLAIDSDIDFVMTIMHHAPDFYRDDIKNSFEEKVVSKSDVLFFGHEHHNGYRRTSYNGGKDVVVQSGGCLCDDGDWSKSSYRVGVLDTETNEYKYMKFAWNADSQQYEHDCESTALILKPEVMPIQQEYLDTVFDEDYMRGYFVFPLVAHQTPESTEQFDDLDSFLAEILKYEKVVITGISNIGKSTLLKKLFEVLRSDHIVLYSSTEAILQKSKNKRQNVDKLIRDIYTDIYGDSESSWQAFEQCDKSNCVFIFDDFDQTEDIDIHIFMRTLSNRFGTIILSSSKTIDFDVKSIVVSGEDRVAKYEIQPPFSKKRKQLLETVARARSPEKTDLEIRNIVNQINQQIKSQIKIIPPEPYFIILVAENYINNVGEAVNSSSSVFSKVFEANITANIDRAIKRKKKPIKVDLVYLLLGRIGYYIHFNKAYPITRQQIANIIVDYNDLYGDDIVTEDVLAVLKNAKILTVSNENSEAYRFGNKSLLAYFVAKEIISKYRATKDSSDIEDIINKCCINICTDILLFIIFQTDDVTILQNILSFISQTIASDERWNEFSIPNNMPKFLTTSATIDGSVEPVRIEDEKKELERSEQRAEKAISNEFRIKDIYDWDDSDIDTINSKLIRMASLLHIISKALPCFDHILFKEDKRLLVEHLYKLPNMIFMYWAQAFDGIYEDIVKELKLLPYSHESKNSSKRDEKKAETKVREHITRNALGLLLNLYYIPVINAADSNTLKYLNSDKFFDLGQAPTYRLENLMILEQNTVNDVFAKTALKMGDQFDHWIPSLMLRWVVRHGIITREDKRDDVQRLQQKFFSSKAKPLLLMDRAKIRASKE